MTIVQARGQCGLDQDGDSVVGESWRDVRYVLETAGLQSFMCGLVKEEECAKDDSQIPGLRSWKDGGSTDQMGRTGRGTNLKRRLSSSWYMLGLRRHLTQRLAQSTP